jgi:hypothetical protein
MLSYSNANIQNVKSCVFKHVTFNCVIDVIFIPSLYHYKRDKLIDLLWYNDDNYHFFRNSAREEIFEYMQKNKDINLKTALLCLYQNDNLKSRIYLSTPPVK